MSFYRVFQNTISFFTKCLEKYGKIQIACIILNLQGLPGYLEIIQYTEFLANLLKKLIVQLNKLSIYATEVNDYSRDFTQFFIIKTMFYLHVFYFLENLIDL